MMKKIMIIALIAVMAVTLTGCTENGTIQDTYNTMSAVDRLQTNQPTPTDIDYSLERYNLVKRAYWVNGQREKAMNIPCAIQRPLGYITLFAGNAVAGSFVVDGKVSSLNSYLTPDSTYYEIASGISSWIADIDGSYGENDNGIFFFTTDGNYIEWTGEYLYSDIPMEVRNPVVVFGGAE